MRIKAIKSSIKDKHIRIFLCFLIQSQGNYCHLPIKENIISFYIWRTLRNSEYGERKFNYSFKPVFRAGPQAKHFSIVIPFTPRWIPLSSEIFRQATNA